MNKRCLLNFCWVLAISLLAACTTITATTPPPPTLTPPRSSLWGTVERIGTGEQVTAPAVLARDNDVALAWTGSEEGAARHYMQLPGSDPTILALKAFFPFQQQVMYADDAYRLFWLDRTTSDSAINLLTATVDVTTLAPDNNAVIARWGPNRLSRQPTHHYTLGRDATGEIIAITAGSTQDKQPALFITPVGFRGDTWQEQMLRADADYPALVTTTNAGVWLYWLEKNGRELWRGRLSSAAPYTLENLQFLTDVPLATSDSIEAFVATADATHVYLFWNLRHASGIRSVLWSSGEHNTASLSRVVPFQFHLPDETTIETGYNSGAAQTARSGGGQTTLAPRWAIPASEVVDIVPVALNNGTQLGIGYLRQGEILGYHDIVESGELAGAPGFDLTRDRDLFLSWAEPAPDARATFYMTSTAR